MERQNSRPTVDTMITEEFPSLPSEPDAPSRRGARSARGSGSGTKDVSAFFISTADRADKSAFYNSGNTLRMVSKTVLLVLNICLVVYLTDVAQGGPLHHPRRALVCLFSVLFVARVLTQMFVFWHRRITHVEVVGTCYGDATFCVEADSAPGRGRAARLMLVHADCDCACCVCDAIPTCAGHARRAAATTFFFQVWFEAAGVIPLTLVSFAWGAASGASDATPLGVVDAAGCTIFLTGTWLNLWPEYSRHVWKKDKANKGRYAQGRAGQGRTQQRGQGESTREGERRGKGGRL